MHSKSKSGNWRTDPELGYEPPVDAPRRARCAIRPEWLVRRNVIHLDGGVAAVGDQLQLSPGHLEAALAEHAVGAGAEIARHDVLLPQAEEVLVVREPDVVRLRPVEGRCLE